MSQVCKLFLAINFPQKDGMFLVFPGNMQSISSRHRVIEISGLPFMLGPHLPLTPKLQLSERKPSVGNRLSQSEFCQWEFLLGASFHNLPGKSYRAGLRKARPQLALLFATSLQPESPCITSMHSWLSYNFGKRQEAAGLHWQRSFFQLFQLELKARSAYGWHARCCKWQFCQNFLHYKASMPKFSLSNVYPFVTDYPATKLMLCIFAFVGIMPRF